MHEMLQVGTTYKVGDIPCQEFLRKCFILSFLCTEEALEGLLAWFGGVDSLCLWHDGWSSQGEAHEQKVGEGLIKHQTACQGHSTQCSQCDECLFCGQTSPTSHCQ